MDMNMQMNMGAARPVQAPGGNGGDPVADLAAYVATCELGFDVKADSLFQDQSRATPATDDDHPVASATPGKVTAPTVYLRDTSLTGDEATLKSDAGSLIRGGKVLRLNSNAELFQPVSAAGAGVNPALITTTKYFGTWCGKILAGTDTTQRNIAIFDSDTRLMVRLLATSDTGKGTLGLLLSRTAGVDVTTVAKEVDHNTIVRLSWFFDGTNLRWKFDDDEAQSQVYAGELAALGTSATTIIQAGSNLCGHDLSFLGVGKAAADNDAQWATILAGHAALAEAA